VVCKGKMCLVQSGYLQEWEMLRNKVPRTMWGECKITITSPTYQFCQLRSEFCYSMEVYVSDEEYLSDFSAAIGTEIKILYDAGVRNIPMDDPTLTFFCSKRFREGCREYGLDPSTLLDICIKIHNDCIKDEPDALHIGIHLCRRNMTGYVYFLEVVYEFIAQKIFCELNYDAIFLE
jgi:methionine synthase II (cobalamin-independent)